MQYAVRWLPETGNGLYLYGPYADKQSAMDDIVACCAKRPNLYVEHDFVIEPLYRLSA